MGDEFDPDDVYETSDEDEEEEDDVTEVETSTTGLNTRIMQPSVAWAVGTLTRLPHA